MKITVIITENLTKQQLEQSYLLCLAWLNFEHQISVVFVGSAFASICNSPETKKQWLALKHFGVDALYQFNSLPQTNGPGKTPHCRIIDQAHFDALKNMSDLLI